MASNASAVLIGRKKSREYLIKVYDSMYEPESKPACQISTINKVNFIRKSLSGQTNENGPQSGWRI